MRFNPSVQPFKTRKDGLHKGDSDETTALLRASEFLRSRKMRGKNWVTARIARVPTMLILVVFAVLLFRLGNADLPPHCLHGDVPGVWRIHTGKVMKNCDISMAGSATVMMRVEDPLCGYPIPDNETVHYTLGLLSPESHQGFQELETFDVVFTPSYVYPLSYLQSKHALRGPQSKNSTMIAVVETPTMARSWTMVYDEGFEWTYKDRRYFAFFKYRKLERNKPGKVRSFCTATMMGWWTQTFDERFSPSSARGTYPVNTGCWYGEKLFHENGTRINPEQWTNEIHIQRPSLASIALHNPRVSGAKTKTDVEELVNGVLQHQSLTEEGQVHWKPISTPYVLIGDEQVTSLEKLNSLVGRRRSNSLFRNGERAVNKDSDIEEEDEVAPLSSSAPYPMHSAGASATQYGTDTVDWSDPQFVLRELGVESSMVPSVKTQGDCGSCYAIAASEMLTSRLWIQHAHKPDVMGNVIVSSLPMVFCSPLSQGCDGGYVYLAAKYAASQGIPTEACVQAALALDGTTDSIALTPSKVLKPNPDWCYRMESATREAASQCQAEKGSDAQHLMLPEECRQRVRATQWNYVGGTYGKTTEAAMRMALHDGPLAASIEPTPEFPVYKQGVFHTPIELSNEYRKGDGYFPWKKVDHAVLIVGYGVEINPKSGEAIPYWKVLNSWGHLWGESGYFRIVRGRDELSIESMAVEATPLLYAINSS